MNGIHPITVPQLNVNDETAKFIEWTVPHGTYVETNTPVSVVETSKAANELCAEHAGVLYHLVAPIKTVNVGQEIGMIGPSIPEIEMFLSRRASEAGIKAGAPCDAQQQSVVTPKALRLMEEHAITESDLHASGVRGAIKEKDVRDYLLRVRNASENTTASGAASSSFVIPDVISALVEDDGPLSEHERAVADVLAESNRGVLLTTAEMELDLEAINAFLAVNRQEGHMLTLLHCMIAAAGRALNRYPRLRSFHRGHTIYRYKECSIGFVVKSISGDLYTPVIGRADARAVTEIARQAHALTMKINRDSIQQGDMSGGCFTISHIASPVLRSFKALPNHWQSAILAVTGQRSKLVLGPDGRVVELPVCTLTLSYDHALCDGMYAAGFLQALITELNTLCS
ncbi:MAG TPA: 2-oxo acid dehydrogenase subunit E2 [Bacteroidota bacterium]|nr:2-oxo acid dehydrogenase subunit E2 [Bacteroidota bacterium]